MSTKSLEASNYNGKRLLTRQEAADYLRVKKSTLAAWACRGGGPPFIKMGRAVRYFDSDVYEFAESNVRNNTSDA